LTDIIQEKTRLSELLAESEENYSYLEAENESLKNKLIYLEADLSQVRETIEQERREKLTISGQIVALEAERSNLMGLTSEITQLTEKLAAAETEKATIKNQVTILEGDFTQLTEKLAASAMVEEVIILEEEPILVEQQEPLPTPESFGEELVVHPVEVSEPPTESVEEREARTPEILEPPTESVIIEEPETLGHSLQDKKIVILGTLSKLNRDEAKELVQKAGGQLLGSPSANTDFVVVGKAPGDKLKKAQKLGITILSEAQFIEMLAL
jgi:NAD-dependent DNA ligase